MIETKNSLAGDLSAKSDCNRPSTAFNPRVLPRLKTRDSAAENAKTLDSSEENISLLGVGNGVIEISPDKAEVDPDDLEMEFASSNKDKNSGMTGNL